MGTRGVSSSTRYVFNLLDGKYWDTWSFKAQLKLEDEERWKYITGPWVFPTIMVQQPAVSPATGTVEAQVANPAYPEWRKGDEKTRRRIIEMVSDTQIAYIRDAMTAAEMWNNLRTVYQREGMQSMIAIQDKISTIKYAGIESGPLQAHLDIITGYAADLKRGNDPLTDYKLLQYTLKSLPADFTSLTQTISLTGHTNILTVTPILLEEEVRQREILAARLCEEHALKAHTEQLALAKVHEDGIAAAAVKAFVAQQTQQRGSWRARGGRGGRGGGGGGSDWKKDVTCYRCGKKGHIACDCRLTEKDAAKEKLRLAQVAYDSIDEDHPKVLLMKNTTDALRTDALFVDSGASRHLSPDRASFITYTILAKPIPIQLGDNSHCCRVLCPARRFVLGSVIR
jgi:hypothetical protein